MKILKIRSDAWYRTYNAALTGLLAKSAALVHGGMESVAAEVDSELVKRAEVIADLTHYPEAVEETTSEQV